MSAISLGERQKSSFDFKAHQKVPVATHKSAVHSSSANSHVSTQPPSTSALTLPSPKPSMPTIDVLTASINSPNPTRITTLHRHPPTTSTYCSTTGHNQRYPPRPPRPHPHGPKIHHPQTQNLARLPRQSCARTVGTKAVQLQPLRRTQSLSLLESPAILPPSPKPPRVHPCPGPTPFTLEPSQRPRH
jgi:hypothetical protein